MRHLLIDKIGRALAVAIGGAVVLNLSGMLSSAGARSLTSTRVRTSANDSESAHIPTPAITPLPVEPSLVTGIRPGTKMVSPSWCTMNFVFAKGKRSFIGTAGHCVNELGESVSLLVDTQEIIEVGKVVFRVLDLDTGKDFALVSIDPKYRGLVEASLPFWEGPTEQTSPPIANRVVRYVGHGLAVGMGGTPRAALGVFSDDESYAAIDATPAPGDSGGPIILDTGEAVGIISQGGFTTDFGTPADAWGPTTAAILKLLGKRYQLVTTTI